MMMLATVAVVLWCCTVMVMLVTAPVAALE